jgi:hypothetical protein
MAEGTSNLQQISKTLKAGASGDSCNGCRLERGRFKYAIRFTLPLIRNFQRGVLNHAGLLFLTI